MATVLELINDLATKAGVDANEPELKALLSATGLNIPISDKIVTQINKGFYTKEAALNDKEIYDTHEKQARGRFYGVLDNKVNQLLVAFNDYFSEEQKAEIKSTPDTPTKYDLINKYLPAAIAEKSKTTQGKKATEEDIRRIEEEFNAKIKTEKEAVEKTWSEKLKNTVSEYENERLNSAIAQKIFSYNLIDNIPGGKNYLADATFNELSRDYHLKYEKGVGIHLRRKDDPEKEVFVNNTKLTVDTVLSEKLKDFVKKSDTQASTGGNNGSPFPVPQKPTATLNDLARQQANKHAAQELAKLKQAS